ncbi:hypothetical protein GE061_006334 [Apolygus lucorum]|uniref:Uncharacterized protein n=1 Tax=Apolygus lucorum TaxID=248454 RepID=A0A6A4JBD7_APOLU|nr:hypothetical protein GE061_006334 [Apolygus lucorum]
MNDDNLVNDFAQNTKNYPVITKEVSVVDVMEEIVHTPVEEVEVDMLYAEQNEGMLVLDLKKNEGISSNLEVKNDLSDVTAFTVDVGVLSSSEMVVFSESPPHTKTSWKTSWKAIETEIDGDRNKTKFADRNQSKSASGDYNYTESAGAITLSTVPGRTDSKEVKNFVHIVEGISRGAKKTKKKFSRSASYLDEPGKVSGCCELVELCKTEATDKRMMKRQRVKRTERIKKEIEKEDKNKEVIIKTRRDTKDIREECYNKVIRIGLKDRKRVRNTKNLVNVLKKHIPKYVQDSRWSEGGLSREEGEPDISMGSNVEDSN